MKKLLVLSFILVTSTAVAQWTLAPDPVDGSHACVRDTGEVFNPESRWGRRSTDAICDGLNDAEAWPGLMGWIVSMLVEEAQALNVSISLTVNPDGTYDTAYPTGNKPPAAASLAWDDACVTTALAGITNLITGTGTGAGGIELAACRSGTNGASGVVSDDSASWSVVVGTDTEVTSVVNTCSSDGSGQVTFTLTYMGDSDISGPHSWACNTAPTSDTLAPSIPTGFEVTGAGTNEIYIKHDPICDNFTGSEAGSGTATYYYRRDASALSNQAAANCTTPQLTYENVGSADGTPSGSQTGNDFTIGFGGSGNDSTADNFRWAYVDLTGDATAIVQVTNLTSTVNFAKIGVAIRDGSAVGAKGCFLHYQYNGNVQMRCRATDDVATTTVFSQAASLNLWVKLQYDTTNQEIDGYYSTDGGEWTLGGTFAVSLPVTKRVGTFITSNSLTTNVTGQVDELNFHNKADVTATLSTTVSGSFDVAAEDSDTNRSSYSNAATGTPNPGAALGKKWNPGSYLKTQGNQAQADKAGYLSSVTSTINNRINDNVEVLGAYVTYSWATLEPSLGNYDWSPIYAHLAAVGSKQLVVDVSYKCFSGGGSNCPNLAPSEINGTCGPSDSCVAGDGVWISGRAAVVQLWEQANMDYFLSFWSAFATEFDGNSQIEMITSAESGPSLAGTNPPNYSVGGFVAQLQRMYQHWGNVFSETNCNINLNFLGSDANVALLLETAYQAGCGMGAPDAGSQTGNQTFDGGLSAVRDYRTLTSRMVIVSSPTLSGTHGTDVDTPAEVVTWGLAGDVTHYMWVSSMSGEDSWANIITAIDANDPEGHTTCPTFYTANLGGCQ